MTASAHLLPALLLLASAACVAPLATEPKHPPAATPARVPAQLIVIGGDGQESRWGATLAERLSVRLVDALGIPVADHSVLWSTTGAALLSYDAGILLNTQQVRTNALGIAAVAVRPTALGPATITAIVAAEPNLSASFEIDTRIAVIRYDGWYGTFVGPDGGMQFSVPIGTAIEWINIPSVFAVAHPESGAPFASGPIQQGGSYRFLPDATGLWRYRSNPASWAAWGWCPDYDPACETITAPEGLFTIF